MKAKQMIQRLQVHIKARRPVLIHAMPGVGKSEVVEEAVRQVGADLMYIHAITSDPTDGKGFPIHLQKEVEDEVLGERYTKHWAEFVPFGDLDRMITAKRLLVVFLDDFGQAPMAVQAAFMQIILARRVNNHRISDYVVFIAATNRREDKAGVTGIIEPVKSRFPVKLELEPDVDEWCQWAIQREDVSPATVAFARFVHSEGDPVFRFTPTKDMEDSCLPRTLANLGRMVQEDEDTPTEEITGCIGTAMGAKFSAFLKIWRDLPDVSAVLMDPKGASIPAKTDVAFALSSAIATKMTPENAEAALVYVDRLADLHGKEFAAFMVREAITRRNDISKTRAFSAWALANKEWFF